MVQESKLLHPNSEKMIQKLLSQAIVIDDTPGGTPFTIEDLEKGKIKIDILGLKVLICCDFTSWFFITCVNVFS